MIFSIYMHVGEGWSERNMAIAARLMHIASCLSAPWFDTGDWSMTPADVIDNVLLPAAYCEVVAPTDPEGTCGTGWSSSTIDFAIASQGMQARVASIKVMHHYPIQSAQACSS